MTMKSITESSVTEGQKRQFRRLVEDATRHALDVVDFDKRKMQMLIENGDELQGYLVKEIREFSVSLNNQFADEHVWETISSYPPDYKPKTITEQTDILHHFFPKIDTDTIDKTIANKNIHPDAEGWFVIPRWEKVAPTYGEAVKIVFKLFKQYRWCSFSNHILLDSKHFRQSQKSIEIWKKIYEEQKNENLLLVQAQTGKHHFSSVRRARKIMKKNEFGLGAFAIGVILLTHPERFWENFWDKNKWINLSDRPRCEESECKKNFLINCPGDEFSPYADNDWSHNLFFDSHYLNTRWIGEADCFSCCASAFL